MLGIDTDVVVRLVVSDNANQTARARKLIEQAISREEPVLVSLLVLLECEWVLRSRYKFGRVAILSIFRALLEARELSFEDEPALEEALFHWKDSGCCTRSCPPHLCISTAPCSFPGSFIDRSALVGRHGQSSSWLTPDSSASRRCVTLTNVGRTEQAVGR